MFAHDLLLDTHVVVWLATDLDRVPTRLRTIISDAERRFVNHVTAFEIAIKHAKNPKALPFALIHLEQAMVELACLELPISYGDIQTLSSMQFLRLDPFDRLLMAQAVNRNAYIVTLDEKIIQTAERYKAVQVL
jgi:PIN domain nuclease of toxin-antitoxin system